MPSLQDYDFEYPESQVALTPAAERDQARLFVVDRNNGPLQSDRFFNLPGYLQPGDCLVLNNVRVLPVRIFSKRRGGGHSEILVVADGSDAPLTAASAWVEPSGKIYTALISKGRKIRIGTILNIGETITAEVLEPKGDGRWVIRVSARNGKGFDFFERCGRMPLPPYIERDVQSDAAQIRFDRERYQTVFADAGGAVAAPTAGLHFTPRVLQALREKGIEICFVTLNVSFGTFRPIRDDDFTRHQLDVETYDLPEATAQAINRAKRTARRVVAVGTTVTRTLETAGAAGGELRAGQGECRLFVYPGYEFKVVDALITNFHLPKSSLLLLACAFGGRERILSAYRQAIQQGARLFSYGDAMLIV